METDYYKLLGIGPDADDKMIRKAWRRKTKEVHPDVNRSADAAVQFRELTKALEILLDPVMRLQHDRKFGYYVKPKNQDSNAKQAYSNFQKEKAEHLVKEWSNDYDVAMAMREEQRRRYLKRQKRNLWLVVAGLLLLLLGVAGFFIFRK